MTSDASAGSTSLACSPAQSVVVHADAKGRVRVSKAQRKAMLAKVEQSGMSAAGEQSAIIYTIIESC